MLLGAIAGCATGGTSSGEGGSAGEGGNGGTTSTQGGGGEGATTTDGGGGAGAEGGGGSTTSSTTTSSTTTSSTTTTSTTTTLACDAPVEATGFEAEAEGNDLAAQANLLPDGQLGFTAGICPAGDIDVFAVPVTTPGSSLRVEVKGANGQCPPGAQTYVRVFAAGNQLLAQDTSGGVGNCSLITPTTHSGVASLAEGTYFVQVENLLFASIPSYLIEVSMKPPSCGDGVLQLAAGEQCDDANNVDGDGCTAGCLVEAVCGDGVTHVVAGEQCDDGNAAGGDGCSETCQFEALLLTEIEPNNSQPTATSLAGHDGAVGSIFPVGDQDWFSFDVTVPGSTVTISTSNGLGACPSGADTEIFFFNPNGQVITSDDDDGPGACSLIAPNLDPGAQNLAPGTYRVRVEDFGNNGTISAYVLLVNISAPGCGDSLLQAGEQCDDGNTAAGDGCSETCQIEGNYLQETEPNPLATPSSIVGYDGAIGAIQPAGDQDVFTFDVTVPDSSVKIEVSNGIGGCPAGFDSQITLYGPGDAVLATDDNGGVFPCSKLDPVLSPGAKNLAPGSYKVLVKASAGTVPLYVLKVTVQPPSCGDGLLAAGEQCDDGNLVNGDGCSDACATEPPWETEPNDMLATAVPPWPGFTQWNGKIQPMGDVDWYKITVQAGQTVTLSAHTLGNPNECPFDMVMHLVASNGTQIVEDDDDGVGLCPLLSPATDPMLANLPAGAYYVWVQYIGNGGTGGPYQLNFTIQ